MIHLLFKCPKIFRNKTFIYLNQYYFISHHITNKNKIHENVSHNYSKEKCYSNSQYLTHLLFIYNFIEFNYQTQT